MITVTFWNSDDTTWQETFPLAVAERKAYFWAHSAPGRRADIHYNEGYTLHAAYSPYGLKMNCNDIRDIVTLAIPFEINVTVEPAGNILLTATDSQVRALARISEIIIHVHTPYGSNLRRVLNAAKAHGWIVVWSHENNDGFYVGVWLGEAHIREDHAFNLEAFAIYTTIHP